MRASRKSDRYPKKRLAEYFSRKKFGKQQACTIINISRSGLRLLLDEKITAGSTICLAIPVPGEFAPINLKGTVQWIEARESDFISGVELTKGFDEKQLDKILTDFNFSKAKINTKKAKQTVAHGITHPEKTIHAVISKQYLPFASLKKAFSFIGTSISLFAFLLFLSLPLFFLMVRGYITSDEINVENHKKDNAVKFKGVPAHFEPAKAIADQPIVSPDAQQTVQNVPDLSKK